MDSSLYRKIESHLMEIISQNINDPDYKLPSERMLSASFNVSRKPVRHAYEDLINKGYVVTVHGKGYFIGPKAKLDAMQPDTWSNPKISLIIPSVVTQFCHDILAGASDFCRNHNVELAIQISDDTSEKEARLLRAAPSSGAKGIILFPVDSDDSASTEIMKLSIRKYPLVLVDRMLSGIHASFITSENHQAMINAVEFLYKKGFQHLVYFTPPPALASTLDARINGFTHGLLRHYKVAKPQNILTLEGSSTQMNARVLNYLKSYPETQVVVVSSSMRMPLLMAVRELGLRIPDDLRLMIIDDELSTSEHQTLKPYILKQDGYQMGFLAAQTLYNHMYGDLRPVIKKLPITIEDSTD